MEAGPFRVRRLDYPAGLTQRRHAHERASVTVILSGAIAECVGSREERGRALSVVLKPPGVEHSDVVHAATRTVQVTFDAGTMSGLPAMDRLARWRWIHGGGAAYALLALAHVALRSERHDVGTGVEELEDRVWSVLALLTPDEEARRGSPPAWIRRVKDALDDAFPSPVPVRVLAREVGAHPVSVSRAFHRHFGCTIGTYRKRARVRQAAMLMGEPRYTLSRVAHAVGYADHPHMCRNFREVTSLTPGQYRALLCAHR